MKNETQLSKTGYGQYEASTIYRGKRISIHYTDSETYDIIYNNESGRGIKTALKNLRSLIILRNKI